MISIGKLRCDLDAEIVSGRSLVRWRVRVEQLQRRPNIGVIRRRRISKRLCRRSQQLVDKRIRHVDDDGSLGIREGSVLVQFREGRPELPLLDPVRVGVQPLDGALS
jgi:hypothetical protein